ncbi:MAG TPA: hypothetical protein VJB94_02120 [Candidatus Nanoarchaeia archaeon]|nr:hypothetical protein [Candidatus Nanoarchaeia archaeon]
MVTTIQIGERTMEQLKTIKKTQGLKSYEEVIQELLLKSRTKKSFFGFMGKSGNLPKMLKELQEERRASDRF